MSRNIDQAMSYTAVEHVSTVNMSLLRAGRTELHLRKYYIVNKGASNIQEYSPPQFDTFSGVVNVPLIAAKIARSLVDSVSPRNHVKREVSKVKRRRQHTNWALDGQ